MKCVHMFSTAAEISRGLPEVKIIAFLADEISKIFLGVLLRVNNGVNLLLYLSIYHYGVALWVRLTFNRGSPFF